MSTRSRIKFLRIILLLAWIVTVMCGWTVYTAQAAPEDAGSFYCWTDQGCDPMQASWEFVKTDNDWPAIVEITVGGSRAKFTPACPNAFFNGYRVTWQDIQPEDILAMPEISRLSVSAGNEPITRLSVFWSDDLEYQACSIPPSTGVILIDPPPMATRQYTFIPMIVR